MAGATCILVIANIVAASGFFRGERGNGESWMGTCPGVVVGESFRIREVQRIASAIAHCPSVRYGIVNAK